MQSQVIQTRQSIPIGKKMEMSGKTAGLLGSITNRRGLRNIEHHKKNMVINIDGKKDLQATVDIISQEEPGTQNVLTEDLSSKDIDIIDHTDLPYLFGSICKTLN